MPEAGQFTLLLPSCGINPALLLSFMPLHNPFSANPLYNFNLYGIIAVFT
jgi:hypothetical protein